MLIQPGSYQWRRYRLEAGTAQKRRLYAQVTWWFGGFYDGTLDQYEWTGAWNPTPLVTVEFTGERNVGPAAERRLHADARREPPAPQPLVGPLVSSYLQYDTDSESVGVNTRLRWTFTPAGDLFVVYNHNVARGPVAGDVPATLIDQRRWGFLSNELLVKLQYAFRY